MKTQLYALIFLTILIGCKNPVKGELNDFNESYKVIYEVMKKDSVFSETNCLMARKLPINFRLGPNSDRILIEHLRIKDTNHLNNQIELLKYFQITQDMFPSWNIISKDDMIEYEIESEKGDFSFWKWLDSNCSNGYFYISKPIFNEDYSLAIVIYGSTSGPLCGGGIAELIEKIDGKWIHKGIISTWIS